jgi:hypothetical protein
MLKELMETVRVGKSFCLSDFGLKVKSCARLISRLMRPGPRSVIAREAGGTIVYDAVAVVVRAGGNVYGLAGIKGESRAENEEVREMG